MNSSFQLTVILAVGLLAHVLLKFGLNIRQVRHVARHRAQVPAAFASSMSLQDHQKAADYTLAKIRVSQWDIAIDAACLLGWTLLGGLDALQQGLTVWLGSGMTQQIALVLAFSFIGGLIGLPLSLYQTFVLEQSFGFNKMTWGLWFSDAVKGMALGLLLGVPMVWLVLWLMQAGGSLWWLWAWMAFVAFQLLIMAIAPSVIMPLFNKFTPLEDESLKTRVQALRSAQGSKRKAFM